MSAKSTVTMRRSSVDTAIGPLSLRRCQARFVREDDRLDPISQLQLVEQMRHVRLDGGLADMEALGDLEIGEAARDLAENLELALCQRFELLRLAASRLRAPGELFDEASRDRRRKQRVAGRHHADRLDQLFGR